MTAHTLYVSTRKGLLFYQRTANGWRHRRTAFLGSPVSVVHAIAQHDSGWPLHDNHPTINPKGQPRHV